MPLDTRLFSDSLRGLRRTLGLTAASLVTLVVALTAAAVVLAVANGFLWRPLALPEPHSLVVFEISREGDPRPLGTSRLEFADWRERLASHARLAAFATEEVILGDVNSRQAVIGTVVSPEYFSVLGGLPMLGRWLRADDDLAAAVVLSHHLWTQRFGADRGVIGQTVPINGVAHEVIGVAPAELPLAEGSDLWRPLGYASLTAPPQWGMRGFRVFSLIGRMNEGATVESLGQAATSTADWLALAYPRFNEHVGVSVVPLRAWLTRTMRPIVLLWSAASVLVLLAALANLVHLSLGRSMSRAREFAIRVALGASRRALVRPVAAEVCLIGVIGGVISLALASLLISGLARLRPADWPSFDHIRLDPIVIVVVMALALFLMLGAALVPLFHFSGNAPIATLRQTRVGDARGALHWRRIMVNAQVAVSLVLLVTGLLFGRSVDRLMSAPTGILPDGVLSMSLTLPAVDGVRRRQALDAILAGVQSVPGVQAAGVISNLPPAISQMRTAIARQAPGLTGEVVVDMVAISPETFSVLGIPLQTGRAFTNADHADAARVVVISEAAARALFAQSNPIGQPLPFGGRGAAQAPAVIVGVVGDVKYSGLQSMPDGAVYMPLAQRVFERQFLVVRTQGPALDLSASVTRAVGVSDASVSTSNISALSQVIMAAGAVPRIRAWSIGALALVVLLVATGGLFSLISRSVVVRTPEIGLRMALGSSRGRIVTLILGDGLWLLLPGMVVGVMAATLLARQLGGFLFELSAHDVPSFTLAVATLLTVGLLACAGPAWRAARVEPMVAWRRE